jgi:hypothetical protein
MHLKNLAGIPRLKVQWVVEDNPHAREATQKITFLPTSIFKSTSEIPSLLADPK